jgi:hypothetical protein
MPIFKNSRIIRLPIKERAENCIISDDIKDRLSFSVGYLTQAYLNEAYLTAYHMHIISDDKKFKEGDWYIDDTNTIRQSVTSDKDYWSRRPDYKKIIASTDSSLDLPKISKSFIEKYISEYNKHNIIGKVLIEYNTSDDNMDGYVSMFGGKEIGVTLNVKDNCVIIKILKNNYNRDEVIELCKKAIIAGSFSSTFDFDDWVEKNI